MWPLAKGGKPVETYTPGKGGARKKTTIQAIEELRLKRENRRKSAGEYKRARAADERRFEQQGEPGDVDFQRMIEKFRRDCKIKKRSHRVTEERMKVCVRKRPAIPRETRNRDWDTVTGLNPLVIIHNSKKKVCGITKYLDNTEFSFDHVFDETEDNDVVYKATTQPLVKQVFSNGGNATVFAYGQTGSGKTYTMVSMQNRAAAEIFRLLDQEERAGDVKIKCSFFEIYGGRCIDLLNGRKRLTIREDGKGNVVVGGMNEASVSSRSELLDCIERGNASRATHATEMNSASSRSHAICRITIRFPDRRGEGRFSLIDLAGSERAQDTKNHNRQRRVEGAEINKSLLALKECIRAFSSAQRGHVPYRASKLTLVLKDSFAPSSKTVMICNIAPTASSSEHTLNTLRYANRIKQKKIVHYFEGTVQPNRKEEDDEGKEASFQLPSSPDSSLDESGDTVAGEDLFSVPLSPMGRKLQKANELSKEGKISEAEKAKIKDDLIKRGGRDAAHKNGKLGRRVAIPRQSPPAPSAGSKMQHTPERPGRRNVPTASPGRGKRNAKEPLRAGANNRNARQPVSGGARNRKINARKSGGRSAAPKTPRDRENNSPSRPPRSRDAGGKRADPKTPKPDREDLHLLHRSLRAQGEGESSTQLEHLHEAISQLVEEEENLLQAHMETIQENAQLLTEEGNLLAKVQGEDVVDYDIDIYAERLDGILERKIKMYTDLQKNLKRFRSHLAEEEELSAKLEAQI